MTVSDANLQRVLSSLDTEREAILKQFSYIDIQIPSVRRGKPPMSENRMLSIYDRADRIELNDL
jgi:hypothetical protein